VPLVQQSLFAEEDLAPPKKRRPPNPDFMRSRLEFALNLMRNAAVWPWEAERVRWFRESYWPEAYAALPPKEAARFRAQIEAESARLDASV
jgi:hypothetical protein